MSFTYFELNLLKTYRLTGDVGFAILVDVLAADDDDEDSLSFRRFRLSSLDPPSPVLFTVTGAIEVNFKCPYNFLTFTSKLFSSSKIKRAPDLKPR